MFYKKFFLPTFILIAFILFVNLIFLKNGVHAGFSDVSSSNYFFDAVNYVQSQKIVSGYNDNTYKTDNLVNRAEFVKIIISAIFTEKQISECIPTKTFPDILNGDWFYQYVCLASNNGVLNGYPDGYFKPGNNINFAEASKIIVNAFGYKTSVKKIWYQSFVEKLEELKAIPDTICSISENVSRGEMAEIIYRIKKGITTKSSKNFFTGNPKNIQSTTFLKSYRVKEMSDSYDITSTSDGGYVITGHTINFNELCGHSMFWIKADSNGNKEWSKLFNNCSSDGYAITQLTDGNYVVAGQVSGEFRTVEEQLELEGQGDNLVVKVDSKGDIIWTRTVSEQSIDTPAQLSPTKDGGFIMSGLTGKLVGQADVADVMHIMFLGNFNTNGETNWLKEIDADEQREIKFAEQTKDDGYILIGNIKLVNESDQDVPALVKLDKNGGYEWATGLESVPFEIPNLIMNPDGKSFTVGTPNKMHLPFGTFFKAEQTNDGGYIALGNFFSASLAKDEIAALVKNAGKELNFVAVKVDEKGKFTWARTLKLKTYLEEPVIEKTKDGGYIIMGNSFVGGYINEEAMKQGTIYEKMMNDYYTKYPVMSTETAESKKALEAISDEISKWQSTQGFRNIMLVKTDANFRYQWGKTIGGAKDLDGYAITQTVDSGYAITGTWHTGIKRKVLGTWQEYTEAMIIKLDANGNLGNDNGLVADFTNTESNDVSQYIVTNKLSSPKLLQSYPMDNIIRTIKVSDKKGSITIASEAKIYNVQSCAVTSKDDSTGSGTVIVAKTRPEMEFEATKEITATSTKGVMVNNELSPILKIIFKDVKLWDEDVSGWVAYRFNRLVTKEDIGKVKTALEKLSYKISVNDNEDFTATKIGLTLNFHFYLGNTNTGHLDVMY